MPDLAVTATAIITFVVCALGLRVAGGNHLLPARVARRPRRGNRAMMDL
ncbi:MAG: hypothetical protein J2P18_05215 [Nocardia sp.]|nr:hypothetical protein [Nocardia sp.]